MRGAPRPRLVVGLGVIALHVALYLLLRGPGGAPLRQVSRPTPWPASLRLLPWRPAPAAALRATEAPALRPERAPRVAAAITSPAPATVTAPAPDATLASPHAAPAPALPASQPPRPLDLSLPRGYATRPDARHPATDDPRANSARLTPEQRMARSFDTQVIEEPLEDGRRRIRRGDDCIIVAPSRTAQLMPFNDAAARTPSLVSACP